MSLLLQQAGGKVYIHGRSEPRDRPLPASAKPCRAAGCSFQAGSFSVTHCGRRSADPQGAAACSDRDLAWALGQKSVWTSTPPGLFRRLSEPRRANSYHMQLAADRPRHLSKTPGRRTGCQTRLNHRNGFGQALRPTRSRRHGPWPGDCMLHVWGRCVEDNLRPIRPYR